MRADSGLPGSSRRSMRTALLPLLLFVTSSALAADFDYGAYQPAKLAEVASSLDVDPRADYWFAADYPRYHTQATFTGKIRPIDPGVKTFIAMWIKATGHPVTDAKMFRTQVEIKQDDAVYWLPIQQVLVEPLKKEVAAGGQVDLYVLLMGAYKHTPVFAVNEFDAAAATPEASLPAGNGR